MRVDGKERKKWKDSNNAISECETFLCVRFLGWTVFPIDYLCLLNEIPIKKKKRKQTSHIVCAGFYCLLPSSGRLHLSYTGVIHGVLHQSSQLNQSELGEPKWGLLSTFRCAPVSSNYGNAKQ